MKAREIASGPGALMHGPAVKVVVCIAMMSIGPMVFAQASTPVTSSVFVHHSYDTGNGAINDNFSFIAHPPARPAEVSAPAAVRGSHRGRRGQTGAAGGGTNAEPTAVPLPQMPAEASSNPPISQ